MLCLSDCYYHFCLVFDWQIRKMDITFLAVVVALTLSSFCIKSAHTGETLLFGRILVLMCSLFTETFPSKLILYKVDENTVK